MLRTCSLILRIIIHPPPTPPPSYLHRFRSLAPFHLETKDDFFSWILSGFILAFGDSATWLFCGSRQGDHESSSGEGFQEYQKERGENT
ncbi:hypothetical protein CDAR_423061 [Caerostris darwini]|uniref:Uncharacterized protein n=1 Tax=Caerostris darwini TaxID=1538125 RepID=A0AAV4TBN4_9ARAC|nr:hypothetical protein CDAR_423061 [Caerostris darwini]